MSDPETQTLIRGQPAINVPSAQGGRSSRAYKVAGLTLLACVLIAGQAMTAYILLSQRSDLKSLEDQSDNLRAEMTNGRSAAVPMKMHLPMNTLPLVMDDDVDERGSTTASEKNVHPQATDCQQEAAGMKSVQVPGFHPTCDERGFYRAQQCFMRFCWCVNPVTGLEVPGSMRSGRANCSAAVLGGSMGEMLKLPDIDA